MLWDPFLDSLKRDEESVSYFQDDIDYNQDVYLEPDPKQLWQITKNYQKASQLTQGKYPSLWNTNQIQDPYYNLTNIEEFCFETYDTNMNNQNEPVICTHKEEPSSSQKDLSFTPEENPFCFDSKKSYIISDENLSLSSTLGVPSTKDGTENEEINQMIFDGSKTPGSTISSCDSVTKPKKGKKKKVNEEVNYTSDEAKNVFRHYGRHCRKFAMKKIGQKIAMEYLQDSKLLKSFKKFLYDKVPKINKIEQFRDSLMAKDDDSKIIALFKKTFQYVSAQYVEYYSHNMIFASKTMKRKDIHIMAKHKILRRIRNPEQFTYMFVSSNHKKNKKNQSNC